MEIRHAEDSTAYLDGMKVLVVHLASDLFVAAVSAADAAAHAHLTRRNPVAVEDTGDMTIYTFSLAAHSTRIVGEPSVSVAI